MPTSRNKTPRVLIVTPEITYLPAGMGEGADKMHAKAGGLADVSSSLIRALYEQGGDVHVTLPNYRAIFRDQLRNDFDEEVDRIRNSITSDRIHLAEDRAFFYLDQIYSGYNGEDVKISLAFQREVINHVIPRVKPDLIHCNDWMTGLIPAMARRAGIPCLFTLHNVHSRETVMATIEDRGIDTAEFWQHLYFTRPPGNYEASRDTIPVDYLVSGVFASHYVNTVSPTFFQEIVGGGHEMVAPPLRQELANKWHAGCAAGILNAPDDTCDPETDEFLFRNYTAESHKAGKRSNKIHLQERVGLKPDHNAPLFFWPSRLDPLQKGCGLLAEILYETLSHYWHDGMQVVMVADGAFQPHFERIIRTFNLHSRVALVPFEESLSRLAYAASDFLFMPSKFEPCGLPQMIGPLYGTLPVACDTGGIHDTVTHLDSEEGMGNGFLFGSYDSGGLRWAIDEAMGFWRKPEAFKRSQIIRIMDESRRTFNHTVTANRYIDLYETMLKRPFIV
ncbi:glycogen synthase [Desulfoluna spongiiphila]|uniref:starch synthase n=1 Tax=Desulfoluna spongiiphila TaxID=419481 RepID=A0A1G5ES75_9BACT|nr:glycogen/starch synthase [Desulfoluna spongiiphila]SCY29836.1 starch synthase/alpha-amylase [Desulfoluna spongiiphila]VVS91307.1 starch synthase catalytic domain [Desulfoluna spongiiphila]